MGCVNAMSTEVTDAWERRDSEPYQLGNLAALKHGAESDRAIEARAAMVHAELEQVAPWLSASEFAPALLRYLRASAREELLHTHIEHVAATQGIGKVPTRSWEQATAAARLAAQLGSSLGLDPIGQARLRATAATAEVSTLTLADMIAGGRRDRLAAQAAQTPQEPLDTPATDDMP